MHINRAAKARAEEAPEEAKTAARAFGIAHGVSNLVNLGSLAANLAYLYIVAARVAGSW